MLHNIGKIKSIFLILLLVHMGCSDLNKVDLRLSNVNQGTILIIDIDNNENIYQKNFSGNPQVSFLESLIGQRNLKIEITTPDDETFSVLLPKDFAGKTANINVWTSLVSCLYEADQTNDSNQDKISKATNLLAGNFKIEDLLTEDPDLNVSDIVTLNNRSRYGLLIKGFESFASEFGEDVTTADLLEALCDDYKKEEKFNGVGSNGDIELGGVGLTDQTLKATFAGHVYRLTREIAPGINDADARLLSDDISRAHVVELFGTDVQNYSFETNPPDTTNWVDSLVVWAAFVTGELQISDDTRMQQVTADIYFDDTQNLYTIPNLVESSDTFLLNYEYPTPEDAGSDDALITFYATDVFGNVATFEYPI